MPYSHFKTLSIAIDAFGLEFHETVFFPELEPIVPSETLRKSGSAIGVRSVCGRNGGCRSI